MWNPWSSWQGIFATSLNAEKLLLKPENGFASLVRAWKSLISGSILVPSASRLKMSLTRFLRPRDQEKRRFWGREWSSSNVVRSAMRIVCKLARPTKAQSQIAALKCETQTLEPASRLHKCKQKIMVSWCKRIRYEFWKQVSPPCFQSQRSVNKNESNMAQPRSGNTEGIGGLEVWNDKLQIEIKAIYVNDEHGEIIREMTKPIRKQWCFW